MFETLCAIEHGAGNQVQLCHSKRLDITVPLLPRRPDPLMKFMNPQMFCRFFCKEIPFKDIISYIVTLTRAKLNKPNGEYLHEMAKDLSMFNMFL